jgi:RimJ/RimL family protein N-acetyltransferase
MQSRGRPEQCVDKRSPIRYNLLMVIRPATPDDAAAFCELQQVLQAETPYILPTSIEVLDAAAQAEAFAQMLRADWRRVFVATTPPGKLLGYIDVTRRQSSKVQHVAQCSLAIRQAGQRRGLGRALLAHAEGWLRGLDVVRFELTVVCANAPAIALYEKVGFVREGIKRQSFCCAGERVDELLMAKILC